MENKRPCAQCSALGACTYLNGKFYCGNCYWVMLLADRGLSKAHIPTTQELWALNHVQNLGRDRATQRGVKCYAEKLPGLD